MTRHAQFIPWKVAGRLTDRQQSADEVVQATGWVFNNEVGPSLTMADFVASGDAEVPMYLDTFGLVDPDVADADRSIVEIGSGIGRMTCALTRRFGTVYACDLDAGFLERCREAVGRHGQVDRLRTVEVADGRTLDIADGTADVAFSYITLQHCDRDDALSLVREALRVLRPGGVAALNFRSRSTFDLALLPLGSAVRGLMRIPGIGGQLSHRRLPTRMAWQVNRLDPHQVLQPVEHDVTDVAVWRNSARSAPIWGAPNAQLHYFDAVNPNHWWLVARKPTTSPTV